MAHSISSFKRWLLGLGPAGRLAAINVAVFLILWLAQVLCRAFGINDGWTYSGFVLSSAPLTVLTHPWTLLTYMFTQYSLLHLIFNMLWLVVFANVLLLTLRGRHLVSLYIMGGLIGAITFLVAYNLPGIREANAHLYGSSASVLAVMTAAAFRSPDYGIRLLFLGEVKLKWIALVCIVLVFISGGGNMGGYVAHIGGICMGGVSGLLLRRGIDIVKPVSILLDRLQHGMDRQTPRRNGKKVGKAMRGLRKPAPAQNPAAADNARLDALLDKVHKSGYDSLTKKEKDELTTLSQRLK